MDRLFLDVPLSVQSTIDYVQKNQVINLFDKRINFNIKLAVTIRILI